jgi:hypothetical protein
MNLQCQRHQRHLLSLVKGLLLFLPHRLRLIRHHLHLHPKVQRHLLRHLLNLDPMEMLSHLKQFRYC